MAGEMPGLFLCLILVAAIAGKTIFIIIFSGAFALAGHLQHTIQSCPAFLIIEGKVFPHAGIQAMKQPEDGCAFAAKEGACQGQGVFG